MNSEVMAKRASEMFKVSSAFGTPIERDGVTIVPVALIAGGAGGGEGPAGARATGSGGGYGGVTRPLGVYVIKDGRVRWVPAVNATLIVLAVLIVVRGVTKLLGRRRAKLELRASSAGEGEQAYGSAGGPHQASGPGA